MAERYLYELKAIKRRKDESLQSLHQDIQRLASLAFRGPWSEATEVIAKDAFVDALNNVELALKIREREPASLDQAVKVAVRLESYGRLSVDSEQSHATSSSSEEKAFATMHALKNQRRITQSRLAHLEQKEVSRHGKYKSSSLYCGARNSRTLYGIFKKQKAVYPQSRR